jgi:hypothetical protein
MATPFRSRSEKAQAAIQLIGELINILDESQFSAVDQASDIREYVIDQLEQIALILDGTGEHERANAIGLLLAKGTVKADRASALATLIAGLRNVCAVEQIPN